MAHLFSPLTVAGIRLANRIVMSPYPSGLAAPDGFLGDELISYYVQRAHGSVGLIISEPAHVLPPDTDTASHIGLYDDVFIPGLRRLVQAVRGSYSHLLVMVDAHASYATASTDELTTIKQQFLHAAWRIQAAGGVGMMLSAADGGLLHHLVSPLSNRRSDGYGGTAGNRLRLALDIVEAVREWLGTRFVLAFRLVAEEFASDGISLQDARVIAHRMVAAGVHIIDVTTDSRSEGKIARFPGWRVPLASGIKRVLPDVAVMSSGVLGDPHLADSLVREGSIDLVMLGQALRENPYWPHIARIVLESQAAPSY
jgi:2,4-dienoyl-CoA reductase-like NADH-dependent reductase (Old Yellow Enzyme family)